MQPQPASTARVPCSRSLTQAWVMISVGTNRAVVLGFAASRSLMRSMQITPACTRHQEHHRLAFSWVLSAGSSAWIASTTASRQCEHC